MIQEQLSPLICVKNAICKINIFVCVCLCDWCTRVYACVYVYYLASSNTCQGSCIVFHPNTLSLVSISLVVNPSQKNNYEIKTSWACGYQHKSVKKWLTTETAGLEKLWSYTHWGVYIVSIYIIYKLINFLRYNYINHDLIIFEASLRQP